MRIVSETRTVDRELYARIEKLFATGSKFYLSFSGGKESLVLAHVLCELIASKRISATQLEVVFIDEEAIYPCVERTVLAWREKFQLFGVKFRWLCMQFAHFNCFNELTNDMSFICWEEAKRPVWVRPMPSFAITDHPAFKPGYTYQKFLSKVLDGYHLIGLRASESVQRFYVMTETGGRVDNRIYPIYDWSLNDVWLFIDRKKIALPEAYFYMWKLGVPIHRLRISQFFSIDTASSLVRMMEFYPELYQKILRREPNAYLAMYYWDSEMFRRSTPKRRKLEGEAVRDYEREFWERVRSSEDQKTCRKLQNLVMMNSTIMDNLLFKKLCEIIESGDPKSRTYRALFAELVNRKRAMK